jgi:hypothetical protein
LQLPTRLGDGWYLAPGEAAKVLVVVEEPHSKRSPESVTTAMRESDAEQETAKPPPFSGSMAWTSRGVVGEAQAAASAAGGEGGRAGGGRGESGGGGGGLERKSLLKPHTYTSPASETATECRAEEQMDTMLTRGEESVKEEVVDGFRDSFKDSKRMRFTSSLPLPHTYTLFVEIV